MKTWRSGIALLLAVGLVAVSARAIEDCNLNGIDDVAASLTVRGDTGQSIPHGEGPVQTRVPEDQVLPGSLDGAYPRDSDDRPMDRSGQERLE